MSEWDRPPAGFVPPPKPVQRLAPPHRSEVRPGALCPIPYRAIATTSARRISTTLRPGSVSSISESSRS